MLGLKRRHPLGIGPVTGREPRGRGKQPRIVNLSSIVGSIALKSVASYYGYSASKAALNMFTRLLAAELRTAGIPVVSIHPGWVQTDMGGPNAPVSARDSAQGILKVIDRLSTDDTGQFFRWDGELMPW